MPKVLDYGGYGTVTFGDDVTDEQIQDYVKDNYKKIENQLNVPPPKLRGIPLLPDSIERGFRRAQQAFNVNTLELGFEDPESAAYDIRQYEQRIKEIPLDEDDAVTLQQISKAETTGEALKALAKNPSVILPIIGESIGTYLPTVAVAGGVALATKGSTIPLLSRIVGGLATGSGSAATEYGTSFIEAVSETGVDINDGIALATAFNDPKVLAEARDNAKRRAIPIGAFDALAFGTAGLLTRAIRLAGRVGLGARVAGALGETVQAGSLGALGEATAQIMTDGFVSRPGEVLLEGIAEGPIGIVEAGLAARPDKDYDVKEFKPEDDDGSPLKTPEITKKTNETKLFGFDPYTNIQKAKAAFFRAKESQERRKRLLNNPKELKEKAESVNMTAEEYKKIIQENYDEYQKDNIHVEYGKIINSTKFKNAEKELKEKSKRIKFKEKKETIDQLADDEFADMEIGELVGKIYNNVSEVAKTRTKDGVGGSKIKPKQIRKKLLSKVEQKFLEENPDVEAKIYKQLADNKVIKQEGKDFTTWSPYDEDTVKQTEKAKKKVRKKKVEAVKLSTPMFAAQFEKKAPTEEEIIESRKQPLENAFFDTENVTSPLQNEIEKTELDAVLQQKEQQSVVTKDVYNLKTNKVLGKIQQIRASGTKPIKFGAVAINNPSSAKIFETEAEATTYLNNQLQNEKQEIADNEETNETPSVALDPDPTSSIDTNAKAIDFNVFQDFIARSYRSGKKTNNPGVTENERPANKTQEQIEKTDERLANEDTPEAQEADEINDAGDDELEYKNTPKEQADNRTLFKKATDFLKGTKTSIGRLVGNWFADLRHLASKDKRLAKVLNAIVKRSEFRGRIYEELMAIMKPWANLTEAQAERVAKVAIFARNEASVKGNRRVLTPVNGEITVTEDEFRFGTQVDEDGEKKFKFGVSRMFDPETITLTGAEIEAYNALTEMGNYERQLIIEQTIDQLKNNDVTSSTVTRYLQNIDLTTNYARDLKALEKLIGQLQTASESLVGVDKAGAQAIKNAISRIEKIGKQMNTIYFPMSRSGDKYVAVTKNVLKDGKIKKEVVLWKAYDTNKGINVAETNRAKSMASQLLDKFSKDEVVRNPDTNEIYKDENGKTVKKYIHSGVQANTYNNIAKRVGPDFIESLDAFLQLSPTDTDAINPDVNFYESLKDKAQALKATKGIPTFLRESRMIAGFDPKDALDAIGKHINSFATWDAGFVFDSRIKEAFAEAKEDPNSQAGQYSEKLQQYLDNDPHEFQSLRQIGFLYFLTDVSASTMNMFQGIPAMVYNGIYAGQFRAAKKQAAVTKELFAKGITPTTTSDNQFDLEKLSKVFGPRIPLFRDPNNLLSSVINPSRANEYLGKQTTDFIKGQQIFNKVGLPRGKAKLEKFVRTLGLMFTTTEVANRLASYISSYELTADRNTLRKAINYALQDEVFKVRLQDDLKLDPNTILQNIDNLTTEQNEGVRDLIARNAVEETQFLYGKETKPRISRGWGALAFQFSEYPTMMLALMKRLAFDKGPEGRKAFGVYMLALLMTSGLMGLPFIEDLTELTEGVLKTAGYKNANAAKLWYDITGDIMHPKFAEAIYRGGFRFAAGVDIGRRVGLGSHPVSGGLIDFLFSDKGFSKASIPLFSVLSKPSIAYDYLKTDDVGLAVAELMPKPFANVMKATYLKSDGYKTRFGDKVVIPDDVSSFDAIMQGLGFTPADIAREREAMYLTKTERNASAHISRRFYRRLQKYQGQLHRAIQAKDQQAIQSARDDIREMYEDIAEHNKKMISDGKINMTVNLRADTIADNFYNEIAGGNRTLSNLPSDDRYMARERLKKLPRGID